jgi:hypothetical protein
MRGDLKNYFRRNEGPWNIRKYIVRTIYGSIQEQESQRIRTSKGKGTP